MRSRGRVPTAPLTITGRNASEGSLFFFYDGLWARNNPGDIRIDARFTRGTLGAFVTSLSTHGFFFALVVLSIAFSLTLELGWITGHT
jgi:hypothetical protein